MKVYYKKIDSLWSFASGSNLPFYVGQLAKPYRNNRLLMFYFHNDFSIGKMDYYRYAHKEDIKAIYPYIYQKKKAIYTYVYIYTNIFITYVKIRNR